MEVRNLIDRYLASTVRSSHSPPAFPRRRNSGSRDPYLRAIGSPTHPVSPETWKAWSRPVIKYQGIEYISGNDPLFTHQFSHAWFDSRGKRDAHTDYFENSIKATKAHKLFCLSLREKFPDYSENLWGISASDYVGGYTAWGGPPPQGPIDGSIVPCATG